jgi:phosphoenolpyruvate-protein kinase (PTS system EI component)
VDELSLNASGIPRTKSIVQMLELPKVRKLAEALLQTESAAVARKLAQSFLEGYRDAVSITTQRREQKTG